jgi:hypothetical protein
MESNQATGIFLFCTSQQQGSELRIFGPNGELIVMESEGSLTIDAVGPIRAAGVRSPNEKLE